MPVDISVPGSPGWWLNRLGQRLADDAKRMDLLDRYYRGDHPLPEGNRRHRATFQKLQRYARSNYVGLVAESVRERMRIDGFRAGGTDPNADREAWRVWQANSMDADSGLVHLAMLVFGRAYVIVGPNQDDPATPIITAEDPRCVVHESDPVRRRVVRAALKMWSDDVDGLQHAVVYLPDKIAYFSAPTSRAPFAVNTWDVDETERVDGEAPNTLGEVPVVPFVNRPRLGAAGGMGEFEDVLDIQDRINNTLLDRLVITKMQAYRQRWAKGTDLTDENGNPINMEPGADLLWAVPDDKADFGDFNEADLTPVLKAIEADIRDLAAISHTPPQDLVGQIINASGDALKEAKMGQIAKVLDRERQAGESWETVNRLRARYAGQAEQVDAEVIWADPWQRTIAELYDAAAKAQAAGVPWRSRMELLGKTPQEIDRMATERVSDALQLAQFPQLEPAGTPVRFTDTTRVPRSTFEAAPGGNVQP